MDFAEQTVIKLEQVSKSYCLFDNRFQQVSKALFGRSPGKNKSRLVLNTISFDVAKGEAVGILGVNGAGKSTLLQLITGVLQPTSGLISTTGRIAALLELGAGFNPNWTGRENAKFQLQVSGVPSSQLKDYITAVEEFADIGIYFDQPVRTYSSGMFVRVAFAAAVAFAPDILIVDEALAVGDARFQNKCYNRINELKSSGTTILLVTHSLDAVVSFCDRGIVLEGGAITCDADAQSASDYYMALLYGDHSAKTDELEAKIKTKAPVETLEDTAELDGSSHELDMNSISASQFPSLLAQIGVLPANELAYLNPKSKNVGTGNAIISHVALVVNGSFSKTGLMKTGDLVDVVFYVEARQAIESPAIGLVLKTVDGSQVDLSASNMQRIGIPAQAKGEKRIYRLSFTARLAGGDYFIDLGVAEVVRGSHRSDDWRIGLVHIVVAATPEFLGPADLSIGVDFLEAPAP